MKKNYFMLAAATMMFAACAETDLVNEINEAEAQYAIGFETFANKATRAENSDESYSGGLEGHHTTFSVWGYKNVATAKVFDGVTVSYADQAWDYVTNDVSAVYWDKAASKYEFYAAAPAKTSFWTLNAKTEDQADDYFTTAEFTMTQHNAADFGTAPTNSFSDEGIEGLDLMIADKAPVSKPRDGVFSGSVNLNFIHILSRLNVTVNTTIDGVEVKNVTVGNIKSKGTFDESKRTFDDDVTAAEGSTAGWTVTGHTKNNEGSVTAKAPVVSYNIESQEGQALNSNGTALIAIEALVIPQNAIVETVDIDATDFASYNEPYLYVEYTINNELFKRAYNLADAFKGNGSAAAVAFNEGWQNTLNLTIGGDEITFTGKVALWADGTTNTGGTTIE